MTSQYRFSQHGIAVKGPFALFWGGLFSNWYKAPFIIEDIKYNCVEQYMMAQKAILFKDATSLQLIMNTSDPEKQKALGRKVLNYNDTIWRTHKYPVVAKACFAKFDQNFDIQQVLLATNPLIIVEASPYDAQWGIGLGADHPDVINPGLWKGENLLGLALMDARARLTDTNEDD